jgi:biopolymer transport protein TolQ
MFLTKSGGAGNVELPFEAAPTWTFRTSRKVPDVNSILAVLITSKPGVGDIILNSGLVATVVLLILATLSMISWAIAIDKFRRLKSNAKLNKAFLVGLPKEFSVFEAKRYVRSFRGSSLSEIMVAGEETLNDEVSAIKEIRADTARTLTDAARGAMERKAGEILEDMERNLTVLATTASVAPFLGLFGTVWGVMNSFLSMGAVGSASLSVVGSGIAEALITTVFGLGAAIPALIIYNYFVSHVRREASLMESFISRVSNRAEREIQGEIEREEVTL